MASPLATTSRFVLGNAAKAPLRALPRGRTQVQSFSSSSRMYNDSIGSSSAAASVVADAPVSSASEAEIGALESASSSVDTPKTSLADEQANRKAYYDNLQEATRVAKVKEAQRELHMRAVRKESMEGLGSTQTRANSYRPHHERLSPLSARQLTVSHLLAATAHVGHAKSLLSKASAQFVYGVRHGQTIIDVEKYTLPALRLACKVVKDIVYRDGVVVFVGTAEGTEAAVVAAAKRLGKNGFHVAGTRWLPGTLSNASRVLQDAVRGDLLTYEKQISEEQDRREAFGRRSDSSAFDPANVASQQLKPDLMVILNPKSNQYAINEATQAGVPTIGVIDTDVDPRLVTYAIPANDESVRTAELIVGLLSKAGQEGLAQRERFLEERRSRGTRRSRPNAQATSNQADANSGAAAAV